MITIREAAHGEIEELIPILKLAERSERGLRWGLANLTDAVYRMDDSQTVIGAATMRWRDDPCELNEIAVVMGYHGRGYGKQFVGWLLDEARRRDKSALLVGTGNSSLDNIGFYQRCGFRMDHVRKNYFSYHERDFGELVYEYNIAMRDMLVFRYEL